MFRKNRSFSQIFQHVGVACIGQCLTKCKRFGVRRLIFAPAKFFLFLVGRYSANFAPPRPRKSFAGWLLVCGGGAKLPEFRPGGGAKLSPGGALFVTHFEVPHRCAEFSGVGFALL
jgi:hypothetical protein